MKHTQIEEMTGSQNRYRRLEFLGRADEVGMELPEGLSHPFTLRWDEDREEARIMLRETLLASLRPWHRDHYRDTAKVVLRSRVGLSDAAMTRIRQVVEDACDFAAEVQTEVKARDARQRAEEAARPVPPPEPPKPPTLFSRIIATRRTAPLSVTVDMPAGGTARALAGLEALHEDATLVLSRGHKGTDFRFIVKGGVIADLNVSVSDVTLEGETATVSIKPKMDRRLSEAEVITAMNEGLRHWNRTFTEQGLVRSLDAFTALPAVDALSVQETTGARNARQSHVQAFGDLSVAGVGLGYTLALRYHGLTFANVIMSENVGDLTGKLMQITPDVMGNAAWMTSREALTDMEMRWRCGANRLDPDDYPSLSEAAGLGI